ncbi:FMN-binding protein [Clostridium sp. E02]|uniref:FMN-binding protein n=1 Tax=Clostridium sp. E02 TaxID=2487134 RepID=UPI000F54BCEF|nr:FMN-binding protein [Clostridium sp. E02]
MIKGNAKRNGYIGLGAMILLAGATIFGSDPLYKAIDHVVRPELYTSGTYTGTTEGYGGIVTAKVTVSNKSMEFIEVVGEKETLLDMVLPKLTDSILASQSTEVDAVSGATISSNAIKEAVGLALAQARGEEVETKPESEQAEESNEQGESTLKDGTYSYEAPEFTDSGYKDQVSMTIKDNTITALAWDCIDEEGNKKSQLSMDGAYVMTEDGPKWHEQAESVVSYVLDHQSLEGLLNQEGYTDSIASVSINLEGFATGVKDCLSQASAEKEPATSGLKEGTYSYESPEFTKSGYKDQVSMTIKDNTITALTWDCIDEEGNKKSQLSMDGAYVMTEDGPKWHEQAESVVSYVLDHQSLGGLLNQEGYTDAIASVSINLEGFATGVKDCLSQASAEKEPATNGSKAGSYSYESPEFTESGYKDQVSMTIKDNTITALTWDCIDEEGNKKSQLSMDGAYVMTEDGPKWHEQAESVVSYVLDHQSIEGLLNQEGYTDAIASVSINLEGFATGVKDCLSQADQ